MAEDLALLGVVIEERGVEPTIRALDTVAQKGTAAEKSLAGLGGTSRKLAADTAAVTAATGALEGEAKQAAAAVASLAVAEERTAATSAAATTAVAAEATALGSVAASSTAAAGGLGAVSTMLGTVATSAIASATGITGVSGALGGLALGGPIMVGFLAALAAGAFAWDKFTESARKSKEEHQQALDMLAKFARKQELGPAGEIGAGARAGRGDVERDLADIDKLQRAIAVLRGSDRTGETAEAEQAELARLERRLDATKKHYRTLLHDVTLGEAEARRLSADAATQARESAEHDLAARLTFNQKDAAARKEALRLLASDRAEYARLLALPNTPENSAKVAEFASSIKQLDEALNPKAKRTPRTQEMRDMDAINALFREQAEAASKADASQNKAIAEHLSGLADELAQSELLVEAARQGTDAYKAQQREIQVLNSLTRMGITLGDERYAQAKRDAEQALRNREAIDAIAEARKKEEDAAKKASEEATRQLERRARDFGRTVGSTVTGALDALGQKGAKFFDTLLDAARRGANRLIGDAIGQLASEKFASAMGAGPGAAATKQTAAGATMLSAAQLQVQAANAMLSAAGFGTMAAGGWEHGGVADASYVAQPTSALGTAAGYGALAVGAGSAGYNLGGAFASTSHGAAGNYARGAIGGAAAGALAGATVGSVVPVIGTAIGAVVGGAIGLVAGLFGAKKGMDTLSAAAREMRSALESTMEALRAEVSKDSLAASIAQVHAQSAQIRKQIEDAYSGGGANSDTVRERNKLLAEAALLEQKRIDLLKEESAALSRYFTEDLRVRELRAQGRTSEADAVEFQNRQARERDEYRRTHDMTQQASIDQYNYLVYVQGLEKNSEALRANTQALQTFMRGAPSGFKLEGYIQEVAKGRPYPSSQPINPLVPSSRPNFGMGASATSATPAPITFSFAGATFTFPDAKDGKQAARDFVRELDALKERTFGPSGTRAAALERMPS